VSKKRGKWFRRAVEAEAQRINALRPITFRTLTIDFPNRTFGFEGQRIKVTTACVSIPILNTEQLLVPR